MSCSRCGKPETAAGLAAVSDGQGSNPQPFCQGCLREHVRLYDCGGLSPFRVDGEPVESWIRRHLPSWR